MDKQTKWFKNNIKKIDGSNTREQHKKDDSSNTREQHKKDDSSNTREQHKKDDGSNTREQHKKDDLCGLLHLMLSLNEIKSSFICFKNTKYLPKFGLHDQQGGCVHQSSFFLNPTILHHP